MYGQKRRQAGSRYVYVWLCDYICTFLCRWYGIQVGWIFGFTGMILNDCLWCLWCILHPRWGEKAWSLSLDLGNPSDPQKLDRNLLMLLVKPPIDECLSHHFSCVNQALVWQELFFTWWLSYRSWASVLESWSMGKPWGLESSTLRKSHVCKVDFGFCWPHRLFLMRHHFIGKLW